MIFLISNKEKTSFKIKKHLDYYAVNGNYINNHTIVFSLRFKHIPKYTDYAQEFTSSFKLIDNDEGKTNNLFKLNTISHNFTIGYNSNKKMFGLGGVISNCEIVNPGKYNDGVYLIKFKENFNIESISLLIKKELSLKQHHFHTYFDTQPSICYNTNEKKYYLYHRYNERAGVRKCQVFISDYYDRDYKKGILVNFIGRSDIDIYAAYVYYQNNKFIGIFKYYIKPKMTNDIPRKRMLLKAISKDGINFKIINYNFLNLEDGLFICQNHEQNSDYNIYYFSDYMNGSFKKIYSPIKDDQIEYDEIEVNEVTKK